MMLLFLTSNSQASQEAVSLMRGAQVGLKHGLGFRV